MKTIYLILFKDGSCTYSERDSVSIFDINDVERVSPIEVLVINKKT